MADLVLEPLRAIRDKLDGVDRRLDAQHARLVAIEARLASIEQRLNIGDEQFARIERRLELRDADQ
jgi:hypothetical protein